MKIVTVAVAVAAVAVLSLAFVKYAIYECAGFFVPSQIGKTVVITGGNSGLGYHSALSLAGAGAMVVLATRNLDNGEQAKKKILAQYPQADIRVGQLDLASFDSVRKFASFVATAIGSRKIDVLMNNAAVMALPNRYNS